MATGKWVRLRGKPPVKPGLYWVVSCCFLALGTIWLNAVHAFGSHVLYLIIGMGALVIAINYLVSLIRSRG
jgi:hypothetical protein